jgi:GTP-binding protein
MRGWSKKKVLCPLLRYIRAMQKLILKNARFVTSAPDTEHLPQSEVPEFAFLGRSNVGKSSLINLVAGQNRLAHTSRTPGRTRLLNYFTATLQQSLAQDGEIVRHERNMASVDLPGFGFAKMAGTERERLSHVMSDYISSRPQIRATLHLVDIRRDPASEDLLLSDQLRSLGPDYVLVVTKADKIVKSKRKAAIDQIATAFGLQSSNVVLTSVDEKFGQQDIWDRMWKWTEACN